MSTDQRREDPQMPRPWLVVPGIVLAAGAWFIYALFYTDCLRFSSVGFQVVLSTLLTAGVLSALIIGVTTGVLTFDHAAYAPISAGIIVGLLGL